MTFGGQEVLRDGPEAEEAGEVEEVERGNTTAQNTNRLQAKVCETKDTQASPRCLMFGLHERKAGDKRLVLVLVFGRRDASSQYLGAWGVGRGWETRVG